MRAKKTIYISNHSADQTFILINSNSSLLCLITAVHAPRLIFAKQPVRPAASQVQPRDLASWT